MDFDVFISHSSEDKIAVARPLASLLTERGIKVWFDEGELKLGDSLRRSIDNGLARSRFGVVILSQSFLAKEWPQKELDALVAREDGSQKVILPVWHGITRAEVVARSPLLADKLAANTDRGLGEVSDAIVKAVIETEFETVVTTGRESRDLLVALLDDLQYMADAADPYVSGVPTGYRDLDLMTSGLQAGSLFTIAGQHLAAKTSFAVNLVHHVTVNEGLPALYFSMGERAGDFMKRLMCVTARIDPHGLTAARLPEDGWAALSAATEKLKDAYFRVIDSDSLDFRTLAAMIRSESIRIGGKLGLVVIDSLDLIDVRVGELNYSDGVHLLRSLARELGFPLVLVAQVESSVRPDPRPLIDDMTCYGKLAQLSDVIALLHRSRRAETDAEVVELLIAKQRNGLPTGTVLLAFDSRSGKFDNLIHRNE